MKFRHELKYLINYGDAKLLKQRLLGVLTPDEHAENGKYSIRSLYFDDYFDKAYNEKLAGVTNRKKYRIRLYNRDDGFIRLECKIKKESYISKLGASLSADEAQRILNGEYDFLLKRPEPVCSHFYYECKSRFLRPRVYVDYEREPFTLEAGDVRITFDSDVRGAYPSGTLTDDTKPFFHTLEPGKLVLEVKFTEFLPSVVRDVLPLKAAEFTAVSKYTLCCDQIRHLTAKANQL